jgi:hypothetical protein
MTWQRSPLEVFMVARALPVAVVTALMLSLVGCPSGEGAGEEGEGEEGEGACPGDVDSSDVDAFFGSLACTYDYEADGERAIGDTTFVHDTAYAIVIDGADQTVTFPADAGDLVFDFAAGGTFEDFDNETNVGIPAGGRQLLLQWDKADESLVLLVSQGANATWRFDEDGADPLPGPLDEDDDHGDLSFAVDSWSGPISFRTSVDGTDAYEQALCTDVVATIDADANATVTVGADAFALPFDAESTRLSQVPSGANEATSLAWQEGSGADFVGLTVRFERPAGSTEVPAFKSLEVARNEGTFVFDGQTFDRTVTYFVDPDDGSCP